MAVPGGSATLSFELELALLPPGGGDGERVDAGSSPVREDACRLGGGDAPIGSLDTYWSFVRVIWVVRGMHTIN
jgi:hypothetical protein